MSRPRIAGFRLGVYIFKDAEVVHLLRRTGYGEAFVAEVARVMEYQQAYELYRSDFELATEVVRVSA